jgi:hypothetical protein
MNFSGNGHKTLGFMAEDPCSDTYVSPYVSIDMHTWSQWFSTFSDSQASKTAVGFLRTGLLSVSQCTVQLTAYKGNYFYCLLTYSMALVHNIKIYIFMIINPFQWYSNLIRHNHAHHTFSKSYACGHMQYFKLSSTSFFQGSQMCMRGDPKITGIDLLRMRAF